ncbi:DUF488 domain-containing protein [Pelomicrobium sp. G1]|uniref:DUF488 domain-containing protein n=1 Tax=unclassified Pelomicrobium TaxID=2815318 RepID=UPI003F764A8D
MTSSRRSPSSSPRKAAGAPSPKGFAVRRVYDPPREEDGLRVLVDRLWPRGLSKDAARVDLWLKDIAPSDALRKWYGHDPARWDEFRRRYFSELEARRERLEELKERARRGRVTLLFGARDEERNNAVALRQYLESGRR